MGDASGEERRKVWVCVNACDERGSRLRECTPGPLQIQPAGASEVGLAGSRLPDIKCLDHGGITVHLQTSSAEHHKMRVFINTFSPVRSHTSPCKDRWQTFVAFFASIS